MRRLHTYERVALGLAASGLLVALTMASAGALVLWALGGLLAALVTFLVGRRFHRPTPWRFPSDWERRGLHVIDGQRDDPCGS